MADDLYLYVLYRGPGDPFYVGVGRGGRYFCHERDALRGKGKNTAKLQTIREVIATHGYLPKRKVTIIGGVRDVAHASFLEKSIIAALRMDGADLTNQTGGGLGKHPGRCVTRGLRQRTPAIIRSLEKMRRSTINSISRKDLTELCSVPKGWFKRLRFEKRGPAPNKTYRSCYWIRWLRKEAA